MTSGNRQRIRPRGGAKIVRTLCCLAILFQPATLTAEEAYQVKAAFLYNFTKFVTWPEAMEQRGGELRLCIFGVNPFGDYVYQLAGRKVRNFQLQVQEPRNLQELADCNILYLAGKHPQARALGVVANLPVLTVSDQAGFAERGGNIELLSEENRIRFDINLQAVKDSGLEFSSKLLQLARQVR